MMLRYYYRRKQIFRLESFNKFSLSKHLYSSTSASRFGKLTDREPERVGKKIQSAPSDPITSPEKPPFIQNQDITNGINGNRLKRLETDRHVHCQQNESFPEEELENLFVPLSIPSHQQNLSEESHLSVVNNQVSTIGETLTSSKRNKRIAVPVHKKYVFLRSNINGKSSSFSDLAREENNSSQFSSKLQQILSENYKISSRDSALPKISGEIDNAVRFSDDAVNEEGINSGSLSASVQDEKTEIQATKTNEASQERSENRESVPNKTKRDHSLPSSRSESPDKRIKRPKKINQSQNITTDSHDSHQETIGQYKTQKNTDERVKGKEFSKDREQSTVRATTSIQNQFPSLARRPAPSTTPKKSIPSESLEAVPRQEIRHSSHEPPINSLSSSQPSSAISSSAPSLPSFPEVLQKHFRHFAATSVFASPPESLPSFAQRVSTGESYPNSTSATSLQSFIAQEILVYSASTPSLRLPEDAVISILKSLDYHKHLKNKSGQEAWKFLLLMTLAKAPKWSPEKAKDNFLEVLNLMNYANLEITDLPENLVQSVVFTTRHLWKDMTISDMSRLLHSFGRLGFDSKHIAAEIWDEEIIAKLEELLSCSVVPSSGYSTTSSSSSLSTSIQTIDWFQLYDLLEGLATVNYHWPVMLSSLQRAILRKLSSLAANPNEYQRMTPPMLLETLIMLRIYFSDGTQDELKNLAFDAIDQTLPFLGVDELPVFMNRLRRLEVDWCLLPPSIQQKLHQVLREVWQQFPSEPSIHQITSFLQQLNQIKYPWSEIGYFDKGELVLNRKPFPSLLRYLDTFSNKRHNTRSSDGLFDIGNLLHEIGKSWKSSSERLSLADLPKRSQQGLWRAIEYESRRAGDHPSLESIDHLLAGLTLCQVSWNDLPEGTRELLEKAMIRANSH